MHNNQVRMISPITSAIPPHSRIPQTSIHAHPYIPYRVVITAVCLLAAWLVLHPASGVAATDQPQYSITTEHTEEASPLGGCTLDMDKPVFSHSSAEVAAAMNGAVDTLYYYMEIKSCQGYVDDTSCMSCRSLTEVWYTATPVSAELLSLDFWFDVYSGGAHPVATRRALNFNTETGQVLQLVDLLEPGWESALSPLIESRLQEGYGQVNFREVTPSQFLLTPDGLVVFFNPYEIASYAQGLPEALLTWEELAPYIRPEGPLGFMQ
ncbi:MAG: DUF3298 domain-containing protein [Desulfovibrio sp.]|nr:MAG: DUF3298 domain-containing protein [Desulfovibrio sp.]